MLQQLFNTISTVLQTNFMTCNKFLEPKTSILFFTTLWSELERSKFLLFMATDKQFPVANLSKHLCLGYQSPFQEFRLRGNQRNASKDLAKKTGQRNLCCSSGTMKTPKICSFTSEKRLVNWKQISLFAHLTKSYQWRKHFFFPRKQREGIIESNYIAHHALW